MRSLGKWIVCKTGGRIKKSPYWLCTLVSSSSSSDMQYWSSITSSASCSSTQTESVSLGARRQRALQRLQTTLARFSSLEEEESKIWILSSPFVTRSSNRTMTRRWWGCFEVGSVRRMVPRKISSRDLGPCNIWKSNSYSLKTEICFSNTLVKLVLHDGTECCEEPNLTWTQSVHLKMTFHERSQ